MPLRRLRCPHFLRALDGRLLLLPSLLSPQLPEGDSGWDWWSMSVKRLEGMVLFGNCCECGWLAFPFLTTQSVRLPGFLCCDFFDG